MDDRRKLSDDDDDDNKEEYRLEIGGMKIKGVLVFLFHEPVLLMISIRFKCSQFDIKRMAFAIFLHLHRHRPHSLIKLSLLSRYKTCCFYISKANKSQFASLKKFINHIGRIVTSDIILKIRDARFSKPMQLSPSCRLQQ